MLQKTSSLFAVLFILVSFSNTIQSSEKEKPLMKDFIGINGHFQFKPELYKVLCKQVRNYQNLNWDVKKPGDPITFPVCVNKVNWDSLYSKWKKHGFEIDACIQFGAFGPKNKNFKSIWNNKTKWAEEYGFKMAQYLMKDGLCSSIEIGNEPGMDFDEDLYKDIFKSMARGIRKGNPNLKIVTCTAHARKADKYSKSMDETFDSPEMSKLYDVINLHLYAIKPKAKGQSPWARSYPEDPKLDYLKILDEAIEWKNKKANDKEIWITEFGYDACTKEALTKRKGWFKKLNWQGVSELEQAQYTIRSLLCFAEKDVEKAFIYFFNDSDQASVHASSGLTRNFIPKPAFWAVKQFYERLGQYRFHKIIKKVENDLYIFEFKSSKNTIWLAWSPTGKKRSLNKLIDINQKNIHSIEKMALTQNKDLAVKWIEATNQSIEIKITESPIYIEFKE